MRWIQLKWSDETRWKNHKPAAVGVSDIVQLYTLLQDWAATKARNGLKYGVELRIR